MTADVSTCPQPLAPDAPSDKATLSSACEELLYQFLLWDFVVSQLIGEATPTDPTGALA